MEVIFAQPKGLAKISLQSTQAPSIRGLQLRINRFDIQASIRKLKTQAITHSSEHACDWRRRHDDADAGWDE